MNFTTHLKKCVNILDGRYGKEDIVADVNEIHNTTFFAHELGKRVFVESGTLFTSVAKLEDILEEFLSRGASEIRFIKA